MSFGIEDRGKEGFPDGDVAPVMDGALLQEVSDRLGRVGLSGAAGVEEQLEAMDVFWETLGRFVPELDDEQMDRLDEAVRSHPARRVLPTPLLDISELKAVAERARGFPRQNLNPDNSVLWLPGENQASGRLIRNPRGVTQDKDMDLGLFYKTPGRKLTDREGFMTDMLQRGRAVAEDGTVWVFPVLDVRIRNSGRRGAPAMECFKRNDPVVTTEVLVTKQLLHQALGMTASGRYLEFANGGVYSLKEDGTPQRLHFAPGVHWAGKERRIGIYYKRARGRGHHIHYGFTPATSGL
ncbi:MAG TPA: hypothetical protein VFX86_02705 [Candidatus Saccharimonadales bacterium]|nr:hypothetical protein [Candidatus Saccharimonadales bacterium]